MTFDEYKYLVGEVMYFYQQVSDDLVLLYRSFDKTMDDKELKHMTPSDVLDLLEKVDGKSKKPSITKAGYSLMRWVVTNAEDFLREAFRKFYFIPMFQNSEEYREEEKKLLDLHRKSFKVWNKLERMRGDDFDD